MKVKHPDNPDDYMLINVSDFREGVHERFEEAGESPKYELKHVGGGRYQALFDGEPLKHADGEKAGQPVNFESKDAARAAADAYLAAQASE